ncbi:MAG: aspartyl/asparaginyl beta-hydroxylase domain-containing protein [Gammaproteobacteria bacterium]|nr:aspartyl/asparaginyl beta-hydroxylase domain-containing protein [Gammaproteobacteria bacterium]MDE0269876.1 aspartyl/asparaginyl beta-hydroxylase domain-containing protein [Gammaproteobacteria bacterium]
MIVTEHFVYIHVSRTGGTFLNKLIMNQVPGARMLQYHGHLEDLPAAYAHLPVIGFVRNPWVWYVSMYSDYRRKGQFVFQILSDRGTLDFDRTVARFLNLGDGSASSTRLLQHLARIAPRVINARRPARNHLPGLRSEHFAGFPEGIGYYSWLFELMFRSERDHIIHFGRFENLREEALRLLEETGTPITNGIATYLKQGKALNASSRPKNFVGAYAPELEQLVAQREHLVIERFGYEFSEAHKYPKTDYFKHLGTANVKALIQRVRQIPESLWDSQNEAKPNKIAQLNETRHIMFRFITDTDRVFDYSDHPVLWDQWKDVLLPVMEQAAKGLGYADCRFPRVMFARVPAGGDISGHYDGEASHYIHKIHVPLLTNEQALFRVGRKEMHLPAGEIFEVNNKRVHSVTNGGSTDRIHLIFECYNTDDYGKPD